ncbi:MAG: hypothetical protein ACPGXI_05640 [Mycobacterium sp.]
MRRLALPLVWVIVKSGERLETFGPLWVAAAIGAAAIGSAKMLAITSAAVQFRIVIIGSLLRFWNAVDQVQETFSRRTRSGFSYDPQPGAVN